VELTVFIKNSQGVFAHFLSGKEFRSGVSEVEAELHAFAMDLGTQFVVGQQQASLGTGGGTAGIEEPGG
jgi:hypothetical protein